MKYDEYMDKECISVCDALNGLPGVETTCSCCGHCREPYRIWFNSVNAYSLAIIARVFDRRYSGTNVGYRVCILTKDVERFPQYIYMIESIEPYLSQEDMEEDIKTIVDNFTYWQQPEFNSYFRKGDKKMSKIERMAEEYTTGLNLGGYVRVINAYKAGANDVLTEIEMTISVSEEGYLESNLKKLINELKGKE